MKNWLYMLLFAAVIGLSACGQAPTSLNSSDRAALESELRSLVLATPADRQMHAVDEKFGPLFEDGTIGKLLQERRQLPSAQGVTGDCDYDYQQGNQGTIYISNAGGTFYTWLVQMNNPYIWYQFSHETRVNNSLVSQGSNNGAGSVFAGSNSFVSIDVWAYGLGWAYGWLDCTA